MLATTKRPSSGPHISTNITNGILSTFPSPPPLPYSIYLSYSNCMSNGCYLQVRITRQLPSASKKNLEELLAHVVEHFRTYKGQPFGFKGACFKPKLVRTFSASSRAFSDVQGTTIWLHLMARMTR